MLNDVAWRKMPTDILTNENMTYIEAQMPKGLEYAPFMFFQAALKKADDDGIFDLEDGLIFSRLMRVDGPGIVFQIANLMGARRIIGRVSPNSNICFFVDWEYPNNKQKTWQQRREAVNEKIENAEQLKRVAEFEIKAPEIPFSTFNCEPKAENDAKSVYCDKIGENVTEKNYIEREKEREIRERDTHTEREIESSRGREREKTDASASAEPIKGSATAPAKEQKALAKESKKETKKEIKAKPEPESVTNSLADAALESQKVNEKVEDSGFSEVFGILETFFSKTFGYDKNKGRKLVTTISNNILELQTPTCSAKTIAEAFTEEFQKMHDTKGVWENIPLQPVYMAKDGVWSHLLEYVGRNIAKGKAKNTFLERAKEYEAEYIKDREAVIKAMEAEYAKYGIDKDDPLAIKKLADARKKEKEVEPEYEGDIF